MSVITRPFVLVERYALVNRHAWAMILAGVLEPVLYLLSMGLGLGMLVGDVDAGTGQPVPYAAFVAPALLASSAMNGSLTDVTNTFFFKLRFGKFYDALLTTPLTPLHVAVGEILWAVLRGALYGLGFIAVMVAFGLVESLWFVLALPATLLIGWAFAAVGMAVTTWFKSWQHLEYVVLATLPMFLFSTTFYPLEVYPAAIRPFIEVTPLYQAIVLLRDLSFGTVDGGSLIAVAYLAVMGAIGLVVADARISRLLRR